MSDICFLALNTLENAKLTTCSECVKWIYTLSLKGQSQGQLVVMTTLVGGPCAISRWHMARTVH